MAPRPPFAPIRLSSGPARWRALIAPARLLALCASAHLLASCASAPPPERPLRNMAIPVRDPSPRVSPDDEEMREDPPDPDPERPFALPQAARERVAQGAELCVLPVKGGPPWVELRLVFRGAGSLSDGERPGLSWVTSQLLASGSTRLSPREHAERLEALGARLSAEVFPDGTIFTLTAPRDRLAEALELSLSGAREPRADADGLARLKKRARAKALSSARGEPRWPASILLRRELGRPSPPASPQTGPAASPADLDRVGAAEIKAFSRRFAPSQLTVVAVGDVDRAEVKASVEKIVSSWKAPEPPAPPAAPASAPPSRPRVLLVDAPGSPRAEAWLGALGPDRRDEGYAAALVASQLLGGGPSARLGQALREAHPLGAESAAWLDDASRGPSLLVIRLAAEPPRLGLAVQGALDELKKLAEAPPPDPDLAAAKKRAEAQLGLASISPSSQADALARLALLSLPDDALPRLADRARSVDGPAAAQAARAFASQPVVVVAVADAAKAQGPLARFGDVDVLSPDRNFEKVRSIAHNPQAPLEPPAPPAPAPAPAPGPLPPGSTWPIEATLPGLPGRDPKPLAGLPGLVHDRRVPKPRPWARPIRRLACLALVARAALEAPGDARAQIPALARGKTVDFVYDARDTGHLDEAYEGRLFLPREARGAPEKPLPFVVFLHGVNTDHTRFRMVGGKPDETDVRLVVAGLVADGTIPPVVLGAPTTVNAAEVPLGMWPDFDLDRFIERSARALRGKATLDLDRVVVVAHSAGGCNPKGGLYSALAGTSLRLRAVMAVDVCMNPPEARLLAQAPASTDVVVTYQPFTWKRPYDEYAAALAEPPPSPGQVRLLEEMRPSHNGHAHNAMIELTLRKHLRRALEPQASPAPPEAPAATPAAPSPGTPAAPVPEGNSRKPSPPSKAGRAAG